MAIIDESKGVLVVRIVYDGPALSGKTTSLQALARGVSSRVECPEELGGRTLFFDWVDYVGGLFDGRQIRCQILSVPGQRDLAHRRKLLLESADAVVLVLDTRQEEWDFSLGWVAETMPYCRGKDPPVGLVVQANKRDAPDAVAADVMRRSLARIGTVALVPSIATTGDGIREAFVLAVRLALDRVRALSATGRLASGKPEEDGAAELLERMREAERGQARPLNEAFVQSASSALLNELETHFDAEANVSQLAPTSVASNDEATPDSIVERSFVPDPMMPGGMIWPPVDGRALLHEVASLDIRPTRSGRADWCGSGSGFRFHSFSRSIYRDLPSARTELIEWARQHSANAPHLSTGRAVILADAGYGQLRLWQIVRAEATLRERLATALGASDASQVASEVLAVATQLLAARESFAATSLALPCTLWTVGASNSYRPTFVGLMPGRASQLPEEPTGPNLLQRELSPHVRELRRARVDYADVAARLCALGENASHEAPARWLAEIVQQI